MHYTLLFAARNVRAPIQMKIMSARSIKEKKLLELQMKEEWELVRVESKQPPRRSLQRSEAK